MSCRKQRARKQPCDIHDGHHARRDAMAAPSPRCPLVRMLAMSRVHSLAPESSTDERHGCIGKEDQSQHGPHDQTDFPFSCGRYSQYGNDVPQVSASDITHEYLRARPIPRQKSATARSERKCRVTDLRRPAYDERHCATGERDEHRLGGGNSVDAVHEIEKIYAPGNADRPCGVACSTELDQLAAQPDGRKPAQPDHRPKSSSHVNEEP